VNNILKKYNVSTTAITTINLLGFNNSNLIGCRTNEVYTNDKCIVVNSADSKIYYLDFNANSSKKVSINNSFDNQLFYLIHNDNIYISGHYSTPFQIGSQFVPYITNHNGSQGFNIFITKLNLQTDFSLRAPTTTAHENSFSQKSGSVQENTTASQANKQAAESISKIGLYNNAAKTINISSIQVYNQVGQLITVVSNTQGINDLMNNKAPVKNFTTGLYFLKLTFKNNTTETIKRFLN
jgi:hypothetical protein